MKKLIYSLFVVLSATTSYAQNDEMHNAKIIGSFELGSKEVTTIYDEVTGCERKTSPHTKNLFTPNESVQIKISENNQMAEVIKLDLPEQVYANKNCQNEVFNYSVLTPDQKIVEFDKIGQKHNEGLEFTYNYIITKSNPNTTLQQSKIFAKQGANQFIVQLGENSHYGEVNQFINEVFQSNNLENFLNEKINSLSLSSIQINYIDSIEIEFVNLTTSQNSTLFNQRLLQLEYSAINNLTDDEELAILSYLAVSRASVDYWTIKGSDWSENVPHVQNRSYWGGVAKADGAGAAAGAGYFGISALFGGPVTWAAFGATTVGYSVASSIYAMFY